MLCEESRVVIDQQIPQAFPRKDVKTIIPVVINFHEGHDESLHRTRIRISDKLALAIKANLAILRDVGKLPRGSTAGLYLYGDVPPHFIGRNNVVMGDISGESGSD